jgi:hypothetical protein
VSGAGALLLGGTAILWLHLATGSGSGAADARHATGGDIVLFGLFFVLVVGATITIWSRIRGSRRS